MSNDGDTVDLQECVSQALGASTEIEHILDKLLELGVEEPSDFQYITENDLDDLGLKKIQIRKLLRCYETGKQCEQLGVSSPSVSPCSSIRSLSDSSLDSGSWTLSYDIPWSKMPQSLQENIQQKERPLPSDRREMIRILASDISRKSRKPSRKELTDVASKVVSEAPCSFQDKLDDVVVGTGFNSIQTQLEHRFQNINRPVKRSASSDDQSSDMHGAAKQQKGAATSSYGTKPNEYQPDLPEYENSSTQLAKQNELKDHHASEIWNVRLIKELLDATYPTVRKQINTSAQPILTMHVEWPFLFEKLGLLHHFNKLVGVELLDTLSTAMTTKVPQLMSYMTSKQGTCKPLRKKLLEIAAAVSEEHNNNPQIWGLLVVLTTYFKEDLTELIQLADDTSLPEEIDKERLPITPCIVALGESAFSSINMMLSIDRNIVNGHVSSPMAALSMLFASFFVFNIEYPKNVVTTLEFVQRCLLGINPKRGCKVKKTWRGDTNPKVLALINGLKDFESDWN